MLTDMPRKEFDKVLMVLDIGREGGVFEESFARQHVLQC